VVRALDVVSNDEVRLLARIVWPAAIHVFGMPRPR
jgi:hypothetical protein